MNIVRTINETKQTKQGFMAAVLLLAMAAAGLVIPVAEAAPSFTQKDISDVGWSVTFQNTVYDNITDQTTFYYNLTALSWEKDLSHWVLEFEGGFVAASPSSPVSIGLDPTTGLAGLKWDGGQTSGTTATYSITVQGHAAVGPVDYSVKGGTYYAIGQTYGPAGIITPQVFSISGSVFLDADGDQVLDGGEPALANVEVSLYSSAGALVAVSATDAAGGYQFNNLSVGTYTVVIAPTGSSGTFNATLSHYFTGTLSSRTVTLSSADPTGNDFPFRLQPAAVLADFDTADSDGNGLVLTGTGKTIGFWKHQLTVALTRKGRAQIDAATLLGFLRAVPPLYLADPFQFTTGREYAEALAILEVRTSDAVGLLKKQLLATELNHVAGLGLADKPLQGVLINWAEYLAAHGLAFSRETLLNAQAICDLINNTGE